MSRTNRGFLRVPRSKRKSEQTKVQQQVLETAAKRAQTEFERAAQRICGVTVKLMLEEFQSVLEGDENSNDKVAKFQEIIDENTKKADLMIYGRSED